MSNVMSHFVGKDDMATLDLVRVGSTVTVSNDEFRS